MKQYEELDSGGRVVCKMHGMLRCGECSYIEQLESENEKLKETLNRIRLAVASPGRSFHQRLLDIEKLVRSESNE